MRKIWCLDVIMTYRVDFCESGSFIMSGSNVSILQKPTKETLVSMDKYINL